MRRSAGCWPPECHSYWSADVHRAGSDRYTRPPASAASRCAGTERCSMTSTAAESVLEGAVQVTYSTSEGLIEISAAGVTKQSGLAAVASRCGVAAEDIVAFGDMPNDVPMLEWVGHGVAMANAHPAVLPVADEVTAANTEDGVAQVLERWV